MPLWEAVPTNELVGLVSAPSTSNVVPRDASSGREGAYSSRPAAEQRPGDEPVAGDVRVNQFCGRRSCARVQSPAVPVANWLASDTASWIFFAIGILSAVLAVVADRFAIVFRDQLRRSPGVVGPLLFLGGVVLTGVGPGRLSWLSIISGTLCLFVFAYLSLSKQMQRALLQIRVESRPGVDDLTRGVHALSRDLSKIRRYVDEVGQEVHESSRRNRADISAVSTQLEKLRAVFGRSSPSTIADSVYRRLTKRGVSASPTGESFEGFANSMVRAGYWAPISIYTFGDDGTALKDAVVAVLREFGLESAIEEPPVRGSWRQRIWARGSEVVKSEVVQDRLGKLERALELEGLGKRQAEIDKAKADAVAALYAIVREQENAVVRMGSIIMIKTGGDLVVWTIGEMQAAALEKHSELLHDPVAALKFLRDGNGVQDPASIEPPDKDAVNG